jgi:hypothetical protein
MARKEWYPGSPRGTASMTPLIADRLEEIIEMQRGITDYDGPDDGWDMHVANRVWPVDTYRNIGYNSGYMGAFLDIAFITDVKIPDTLRDRAQKYVYQT